MRSNAFVRNKFICHLMYNSVRVYQKGCYTLSSKYIYTVDGCCFRSIVAVVNGVVMGTILIIRVMIIAAAVRLCVGVPNQLVKISHSEHHLTCLRSLVWIKVEGFFVR
jgi:hypothetical protein